MGMGRTPELLKRGKGASAAEEPVVAPSDASPSGKISHMAQAFRALISAPDFGAHIYRASSSLGLLVEDGTR